MNENYTDESLADIIISARETGNFNILKEVMPEALKRGLVKECEKCTCMFLQEDFDSHECEKDSQPLEKWK